MSRVSYNSKRLIPAPLVTVTKQFQSTEDGTKVGAKWGISIIGTCVTHKGSPKSDGTFWTSGGFPPDETIADSSMLAANIRKIEAIRTLFSEDGHTLEFQSEDGSQPMKCNPKVESVVINDGTWYDRFSYNISLSADVIYVNGTAVGEDLFSEYIESATESWQIETLDEPQSDTVLKSFRLTHNVSAKGKRFFNDSGTLQKEAWEQAKDWVSTKIGLDASIISGSLVPDISTNAYNRFVNETVDKYGGQYSISETWLLTNESTTESYESSVRTSIDNAIVSVSIDGSITGLNTANSSDRFTNAKNKFDSISGSLFSRANSVVSGLGLSRPLNSTPISTTYAENKFTGTVKYTYEYDNRLSNLITGALSENLNISDSLSTEFFVPIFVLGRSQGPVLQNLLTSKEKTRTVNFEVVMGFDSSDPISSMDAVIDSYKPTGTTVGLIDNTMNRDVKSMRYARTKTWIYE